MPIQEVAYWLSNGVLTFDFGHSKGRSQVKVMHIFTVNMSQMVTDIIEQILLLPIRMMSPIDIRMVYLHLTLAHTRGQCQVHAHFDCESFENSDRYYKNC